MPFPESTDSQPGSDVVSRFQVSGCPPLLLTVSGNVLVVFVFSAPICRVAPVAVEKLPTKAPICVIPALKNHRRICAFSPTRVAWEKLLAAAERFAREAGYAWIYLDTTSQMVAAARLYERNGY